jgi:hypothetical protein
LNLLIEEYEKQKSAWPRDGRHILAQYDEESIVVYQAYRPAIGLYAVQHGAFGGEFSYSRMSWIKPNFLWMMYRSGWASKEGQEIILGLRLRRSFFDSLLKAAVASTWKPCQFATEAEWTKSLQTSDVRLQWDPDYDPKGGKEERRAIQLGLRGNTLEAFGKHELLEVIDLSDFVAEQRQHLAEVGVEGLSMPRERVYRPEDEATSRWIDLSLN